LSFVHEPSPRPIKAQGKVTGVDDHDPEVLRMAAVVAFRQGRLPLMRELTQRCLGADSTGAFQNARIVFAFAEHRWTDVCDLVDHHDAGNSFDKTITLFLKSSRRPWSSCTSPRRPYVRPNVPTSIP
jgi:hypothetical protein